MFMQTFTFIKYLVYNKIFKLLQLRIIPISFLTLFFTKILLYYEDRNNILSSPKIIKNGRRTNARRNSSKIYSYNNMKRAKIFILRLLPLRNILILNWTILYYEMHEVFKTLQPAACGKSTMISLSQRCSLFPIVKSR